VKKQDGTVVFLLTCCNILKKNMKNLCLLLSTLGFIFTSCDPDSADEDKTAPEIQIHAPQSTNMPAPGSNVNINAQITDENKIHNIDVHITAATNPDTMLMMHVENINSAEFNLDTSFTANIHLGMMSNYTVEIDAEDTSGNISSKSVTFHVMDM